ncbi:MAG TPA: enoyl-CoA hydratase/isomerase family protein [Acidimicrobiales bacterium]|nr:enoyl-CoA hydratase/isomerase family protein [Acidimicrobiales bacterium]
MADAERVEGATARAETSYGDVAVSLDEDFVATVEIRRPPDNFFDVELIRSLGDAYEVLDAEPRCRAIVLCSEGKNFCAGADFTGRARGASAHGASWNAGDLYREAVRLFGTGTPVIAAVQGAAVGGGLGVACSADFRICTDRSRFAANFARLGFHHGFGLTVTLPLLVGHQRALELLYTGRRVSGPEAVETGLCDKLVDETELRTGAHAMAGEIARSAPLAVRSIRETMRGGLAEQIRRATAREREEQDRLRLTSDWVEGVRASSERRAPRFEGR